MTSCARSALLAALVATALAGGSPARAAGSLVDSTTAGSRSAERALRAHLEDQYLSVRWVRCVDSGLRYRGTRSFRCNVNFGDPHIVAYCGAFVGGAFVTDRRLKDLRCYLKKDESRYKRAALLPSP